MQMFDVTSSSATISSLDPRRSHPKAHSPAEGAPKVGVGSRDVNRDPVKKGDLTGTQRTLNMAATCAVTSDASTSTQTG